MRGSGATKPEGAKRPSGGGIRGRVGEGGCPPSHGREIFHFWGSESCNLVHAVMKFLTLYLIRIWIKIITYSTTHTETGSEYKKKVKTNLVKSCRNINTSKYIYNHCSSLYLWYGAINDSIPTKH